MCSNFRPASIDTFCDDVLQDIRDTKILFKPEVFPNETAPIIRLEPNSAGDADEPVLTPARFGLVPPWVKANEITKYGRMDFNSRTETVSVKNRFRGAWSRRQFCLIPVAAFYEPNWETGKAIRWRIEMANHVSFAIGGLWERHGVDANYFESFSMLTINADTHAVMNHLHRPRDEKRMPVIIGASDYRVWLGASSTTATQFFQAYPNTLMTSRPEPLQPRTKLLKSVAKPKLEVLTSAPKLV